MTRSDIQVLIDAIQSGTPNTAETVRTVLNAIADGAATTGTIKMMDVSNTYITDNFDASGLGKNLELGWAICNGNNGTRDRGGRVPLQYNSTYAVLGATGGSATHTLLLNEIPSHSHVIKASVNTSGGAGGNSVSNVANNAIDMNTQSAGSGQAHNNLQPYMVTLFVMKL